MVYRDREMSEAQTERKPRLKENINFFLFRLVQCCTFSVQVLLHCLLLSGVTDTVGKCREGADWRLSKFAGWTCQHTEMCPVLSQSGIHWFNDKELNAVVTDTNIQGVSKHHSFAQQTKISLRCCHVPAQTARLNSLACSLLPTELGCHDVYGKMSKCFEYSFTYCHGLQRQEQFLISAPNYNWLKHVKQTSSLWRKLWQDLMLSKLSGVWHVKR
jgi:hypothetical protein